MPIVELANHGHASLYERQDGVGLSGRFDGEILARYGLTDALDIFNNWGFASEDQPFALSLRTEVRGTSGSIRIGRGDVSIEPQRELFLPDVSIEGDRISLSYLMLGHRDQPALARDIFRRILRDAGHADADELFDRILEINRAQFEKLIAAITDAAPPLDEILRRVARVQLEAMAHNVSASEPSLAG
jgi:hypothetical protein